MSSSRTTSDMPDFPQIEGQVLFDERMSRHTTFRIGGPADIFAVPEDVSDLQVLLCWAKTQSVPVFVLGAGSNILVADRGIRGMVIQLGKPFSLIGVNALRLKAGAAARLSRVVRMALGRGLSGLECLVGIPGTVGGAVCMNAGTPAGCIKDSLESVSVLCENEEVRELPASDLGLDYRTSIVPGSGLVLLEATFQLRLDDEDEACRTAATLLEKRKQNQPGNSWTAGSVFKNPPDGFAGQLLEAVGAKGVQIGHARVSSKHANFIENAGEARAEDVRWLIDHLQRLVAQKFGVTLEPEIQLVGEF